MTDSRPPSTRPPVSRPGSGLVTKPVTSKTEAVPETTRPPSGSMAALDPALPARPATGKIEAVPERPGTSPGSDQKFQTLSRNLLAGLYMLVRSVKLYDPDNAVFQKPINALLETVNALILNQGKLDLAVVQGSFYVNGQLVRVEQGVLEQLKFLAGEMERRQVGGFALHKPASLGEIKNFIWIFAKDQNQDAGEDGVDGKKLVSMRLTRWAKLKEKLANDQAEGQVDRKKYAMTVYARLIVFVDHLLSAQRKKEPAPPTSKLARLLQDMVDVTANQGSQFLGMTSTGEGDQALTYHLVNTALLCVAFGSELGLNKQQLKDLGLAAVLSGASLWRVPPDYRFILVPEKLAPEVQHKLKLVRREGARAALLEPGAGRLQFFTALTAVQLAQPYGKAVKDARGRINMIVPEGDPLYFSRIVALCSYYDRLTSTTPDHEAYGPEIALDLMWNRERHRFDPELLAVFVRVMAKQPIKLLSKKQGGVVDLVGV